jgi:hypothetical protein
LQQLSCDHSAYATSAAHANATSSDDDRATDVNPAAHDYTNAGSCPHPDITARSYNNQWTGVYFMPCGCPAYDH